MEAEGDSLKNGERFRRVLPATLELIVPDICAYKFDKEVITEGSRKGISASIELKEA
jgi:hypothetical protein